MNLEELKQLSIGDARNTFLCNIMNPERSFSSEQSELEFLRTARTMLSDELLSCFSFLEERGLLSQYFNERDNFC